MVIEPGNNSFNKGGINPSAAGSSRAKSAQTSDRPSIASQQDKLNTDSVSLSDQAQTMGRLEASVQASPDVNEAKVEALKQAIAEGRYEINSESIAERMLAQDAQF